MMILQQAAGPSNISTAKLVIVWNVVQKPCTSLFFTARRCAAPPSYPVTILNLVPKVTLKTDGGICDGVPLPKLDTTNCLLRSPITSSIRVTPESVRAAHMPAVSTALPIHWYFAASNLTP